MRTLLLAFAFFAAAATAQPVYDTADPMPQIEGGFQALQEAVVYPEEARQQGLAGRVIVGFVVDARGRVTDAAVMRGAHPLLDEAALTAVRAVGFEPGRLHGSAVAVRLVLPITFALTGEPEAADGALGGVADEPEPEPEPKAPPVQDDEPAEPEPVDEPEPEPEPVDEPRPDDGADDGAVADNVDEMPEIIGGLGAIVDRVVYPPEAEEQGIEGRVFVLFVVGADGAVSEAEVVQGIHPLLDQAALDAVLATRFRPGRQNGRPVAVRMVLPVTFALPSSRG